MVKKKEIWNAYRKLMANLLPAVVFVPFFAAGMLLYQRGLTTLGVLFMAASPVIGVIAVNYLGLFENAKMRKELGIVPNAKFVGLGKPGSIGFLDPHDDIGWFHITPEAIEFTGEKGHYRIQKREILGIRFRPNVHTILGLGRWISIEAKREGKQIRMLIEPRVHNTLLQNKQESRRLMSELQQWLKA